MGQSFDDRRLAHARFSDQHGIVFGPAREHLHDAPDFVVAADHRVDLPLPSLGSQIRAVFFQRLKLALGIGVADPLIPPHFGQGLHDRRFVESQRAAQGGQLSLGRSNDSQQQMFGADVVVLESFRLLFGFREHSPKSRTQILLADILNLGHVLQDALQFREQLLRVATQPANQRRYDSVGLIRQIPQEMFGLYFLVGILLGDRVQAGYRLLGFDGKSIQLHDL